MNPQIENSKQNILLVELDIFIEKNWSQKKQEVYKIVFRLISTYGCESWTLSTRSINKIQSMEMKFLRKVKGVNLTDRIRITQIWE